MNFVAPSESGAVLFGNRVTQERQSPLGTGEFRGAKGSGVLVQILCPTLKASDSTVKTGRIEIISVRK